MKQRIFALVLVLLVFHVPSSFSESPTESTYQAYQFQVNSKTPETFKLLVYNIWETGRNPEWKDVVKQENPDIIVAVETGKWEGPNDGGLQQVAKEFNTYFSSEKPYEVWATSNNPSVTAGEAIFSRYPIVNGTTVEDLVLDDGTIKKAHNPFMDVVVNISGIVTHIIGVHLKCCSSPSGAEARERESDTEGIINYMDNLGNVPVIYAGDLNSFNPFDVKVLNSGDNLGYGPLEMMLNSSHPKGSDVHTFYDMYRELNPYDRGYTFIDAFYQSRIDFIIINQYFYDMMINSSVIMTEAALKGSDHLPVDGWFNLQPELADLRPPERVYNVRGNLTEARSPVLSWNASMAPDLDRYIVYRNSTNIGTTNATTFTDNTTETNTIYKYQIAAADNSSNQGKLSHPLFINTSYGVLTAPTVPVNVTIVPGINQLTIVWDNPLSTGGSPIQHYIIYRSTSPTGIFIEFGKSTTNSFTDTSTISAFTYYYQVKAINAIGQSEASAIVSGSPNAPPTTEQSSNEQTAPFPILFSIIGIPILIRSRRR